VRGSLGCSSGTIVKLICLRSGWSDMARFSDGSARMSSEARGTRPTALRFVESIFSHDPDDDALDLHVIRVDKDRLHRRVCGLETHTAVFSVQLLQRDVAAANQRDHHFTVVCG